MTPSKNCYDLIKREEGLRLDAYPDPGTGDLPITIGYGSTMYEDGSKIKLGERITMERAEKLLQWEVNKKAVVVDALTNRYNLTQNQFDALVSFAYNVGVGAFERSTMLKKIRHNPNDPLIDNEFKRWVRAGGKVLKGLVKRRNREAELYFS